MKQLFPFLLCSVVLLVAACGSPGKTAKTQPGSDSTVTAMLKAQQLEGRVVLVEFGTIGCQLSGVGLDSMAEWQRRNAVPGLAFLRLEPTADKQTFDSYYSTKTLGFPVVHDTAMTVATALGTAVYPRFVLLDKFGRVRYRGIQPAEKDLAEWTGKLSSEKTDAGPSAPQFGTVALVVPALLAETKLPALDGKVMSLRDCRGKNGLLLLFVDTYCPHSAATAKDIPAVAQALNRRDVPVVVVNIGDPEARVKSFYSAGIAGATIVFDTGKTTQDRWNIQYVPTAVLLDAAGNLVYSGSPVWDHVTGRVAAALNLPAESVKAGVKGTSGG
jgi:thiol-disulfide isomerase/thioredoxin